MALLDNKPMAILVAINIVSFMLIFWLIGMVMGKNNATPPPVSYVQSPVQSASQSTSRSTVQSSTQPSSMQTAVQQARQNIAASAPRNIGDAIANELATQNTQAETSIEPVIIEKTTTIDVYYDGSIAHIEKTDDAGNKTISISNNLKEIEKLSESDAAYMAQYKKMKQGEISYMSMYQVTQEEAQQVKASQTAAAKQEVNYFNKVSVDAPSRTAPASRPSLAQQIQSLVRQDSAPATRTATAVAAQQQDYIATLQSASEERKNETRSIKVKLGDSLWKIAVRAYGNGFDYPRIFKANPHIKNPDMIRIGETLRVPL